MIAVVLIYFVGCVPFSYLLVFNWIGSTAVNYWLLL